MAIDVFVSVGRTMNQAQEDFVEAVEDCLRGHDLVPHTLGRSDWSDAQPLKAVSELMARCAATIILAFERIYIEQGEEQRASPSPSDLAGVTLPTVWNHIEAGLAYSLGHPILVLAEDGLRSEGLLQPRYDWTVQTVPLESAALHVNPCRGVIKAWSERAQASMTSPSRPASQERIDPAGRTVADLVGDLKPGQLRILVVSCIGVIGAAFSAGVTIGH